MKIAYCDESGKHHQAQSFLMCGFVCDAKQGDRLSSAWSAVLKEERIKAFHATDCEVGHGEFNDMNVDQREHIQTRLIRVILDLKIRNYSVSIFRSEFETVKNRLRTIQKYKDIYFLGFEAAIVRLMEAANGASLAFYFDRQKEFQGRAKELYDTLMKDPSYRDRKRLGPLVFASKEQAIPLQAIDLFAYEAYRYNQELGQGRRRRWQLRMLDSQKPRPLNWTLNAELLATLAQRMEERRYDLRAKTNARDD